MQLDAHGQRWYRGNLHAHTTLSDGKQPPEKCIEIYRSAGYDFLAITDHWRWHPEESSPDFLLLSGAEYDTGTNDVTQGVYHILGVGAKTPPALIRRPAPCPQGIIDAIHQADGIAILAHPAWSLNRSEEVAQLSGFDGTEIYNTVSGIPWNARPYSGQFVDELAVQGRYLPCMAAADVHFYQGDQTRSYLMVQCDALSREDILNALRQGRYYATQGPRVESFVVEDGVVKVECSPVQHIVFYSNAIYSSHRVASGEGITQACYPLQEIETYVRVELIDAQGNTAWTSPVAVKKP